MAIRFPLKMSDGTLVKTIEDLRNHFDLVSVLGYYENGRLVKWLRNDFCDKEAVQVENLTADSSELPKELCNILGVPFSETGNSNLNLDNIVQKNRRRDYLQQFTSDEGILSNADSVAFAQDELSDLLRAGRKTIYLSGEHFIVPGSVKGITYVGVNNPSVEFSDEIIEQGIDFQNLNFDMNKYLESNSSTVDNKFARCFSKNLTLGIKLLRMEAENRIADAQYELSVCYYYGYGVEKDEEEAVKWSKKAAEQGHVDAQCKLGHCYYSGIGVKKDKKEAAKWYRKAAEQGSADAQYRLGECYYIGDEMDEDEGEAVKWYRKAAEQGHTDAQCRLGHCYHYGIGLEKSKEKAIKWYKKAAEQGHTYAKYMLRSYEISEMAEYM